MLRESLAFHSKARRAPPASLQFVLLKVSPVCQLTRSTQPPVCRCQALMRMPNTSSESGPPKAPPAS